MRIYISYVLGNDANDGLTKDTPVKSTARFDEVVWNARKENPDLPILVTVVRTK